MTNCLKTAYNGIPATIAEFKAFVDDLAHQKLEKLGNQNPCADVPSDQYDSPDTPKTCKKMAHELRWETARYTRRYLREGAARDLDPIYDGQMTARDQMRVAAIEKHKPHHSYSGWFGGATGFLGSLNYVWQHVSDTLGIGSPEDYLDDIKSGKNLDCIGASTICDTIEKEVDEQVELFTKYKVETDDGMETLTYGTLETIHVLEKNKHDPDGCKEGLRILLGTKDMAGEVGTWMQQLSNKLVALGVRPEPVEEEVAPIVDDVAEAAPPAAPAEPLMCTPVTQKALIAKLKTQLKEAREALQATYQICKVDLKECNADYWKKVISLDNCVTATQQQEARAVKAETALKELRAQPPVVAKVEPKPETPAVAAPAKPKPKPRRPKPASGMIEI